VAGDGFYFGLVNEWAWSDWGWGETRKLAEGAVCVCGVWNLPSPERSGRGDSRTIPDWMCSEEGSGRHSDLRL
jgi:hypothetical protein